MPTVTDYTALLAGEDDTWTGATGHPVFLTYSFSAAPPAYLTGVYSIAALASFQPLTDAEKAMAREAIRQWGEASGVTFFEVASGQGDINFGKYDFNLIPDHDDAAAFAPYPYLFSEHSDVFVNTNYAPYLITFLHEIGHALGLKHPFDDQPRLDSSIDDSAHTVMSYHYNGTETGLGPLDVAAIQHIYGLNSADGTQAASWTWDAAAARLTQTGGVGNDVLTGVAVSDVLDGDAGDDQLIGRAGSDSLQGGIGDDDLTGGSGADTLEGGIGDDTLDGGSDSGDVVRGGAGDDVIWLDFGATSQIDGGGGEDTLFVNGWFGAGLNFQSSVFRAQATFTSVENIAVLGSLLGGDTVVGAAQDDYVFGYGGNDSLDGSSGDDLLTGDDGADTLVGGEGDDWLEGGAGNDWLIPGSGSDAIFGDSGSDTVDYSGEDDALNITINSARVTNQGFYEDMSEVENVVGTRLADLIYGDGGDNRIFGGAGGDTISGGDGLDYLRGEDGNDSLIGGAGFDDIQGNVGNDVEYGGLGNDWVVGGKDDDLLFGEDGDDVMNGNLGNDTVTAADGADIVRGGQGDDTISGGAGNDWTSGDRGDDTISGGAGADIFHGFSGTGLDRIVDFSGAEGDRVQLDPGTTYTVSQVGADTVVDLGGGDRMVLVGVQLSGLQTGWIFVG